MSCDEQIWMYAYSGDGLAWFKPPLGVFNLSEVRPDLSGVGVANNIVVKGGGLGFAQIFDACEAHGGACRLAEGGPCRHEWDRPHPSVAASQRRVGSRVEHSAVGRPGRGHPDHVSGAEVGGRP